MALVDATIVINPSNVVVTTEAAPTVQLSQLVGQVVVSGAVGIRGPIGPTGPVGPAGSSGTLLAGLGIAGGGNMSSDIQIDLAVDDLVAGALVYDEMDYIPVFDHSNGQTIKVALKDVMDGGVF